MTTRWSTPPRGLHVAAHGVDRSWARLARVVHIGQHAVLLTDDRARLLPLTDDVRGLVAGGARVTAAELAALARDLPAGAVVDLTTWADALGRAPRTDLTVRPGAVDAPAARLMARLATGPTGPHPPPTRPDPMDARPVRALAPHLVAAAATDDVRTVDRLVHALVGAGPGSTPAGDDVLVGVLAGLDRRGAETAAARVRAPLPALLHRTTTASRHDLQSALLGQVAERVHRLLDALAAPAATLDAVAHARTWGASSGLDLATGVAAGALVARCATVPPTPSLRRSA